MNGICNAIVLMLGNKFYVKNIIESISNFQSYLISSTKDFDLKKIKSDSLQETQYY